MKEVELDNLQFNPFEKLSKDWCLITATKNNKTNTMTASWGGFGVLWNKPVVTIYLRPQRYTKEFIDLSGNFTISFYDDEHKKTLSYLGTVSGRKEDKISKSGLTLNFDDEFPYFEESNLVFECKVIYEGKINETGFKDGTLINNNYPNNDFHSVYVAEVIKVLKN